MSFSMVRNGEFCSQIQGDPDDADHDQRMAVPLRVLSGACLDQNFWKKIRLEPKVMVKKW